MNKIIYGSNDQELVATFLNRDKSTIVSEFIISEFPVNTAGYVTFKQGFGNSSKLLESSEGLLSIYEYLKLKKARASVPIIRGMPADNIQAIGQVLYVLGDEMYSIPTDELQLSILLKPSSLMELKAIPSMLLAHYVRMDINLYIRSQILPDFSCLFDACDYQNQLDANIAASCNIFHVNSGSLELQETKIF